MSDLFLSYAREDRETAERLARALEGEGWSVWWDRELVAGERFSRVIEEELRSARAVVVVWSRASAASPWVEAEATVGFERGVLVPVRLETCEPPLPFRTLETEDFQAWRGETGSAEIRALADGIRGVLGGRVPAGTPSRVPELLVWSEEARAEVLRLSPDEEGNYWWWLLKQPARADRLRLAVLLAAEAWRRDSTPDAEAALRGGLALLTRPVLDAPCYGLAASAAWSPDGRALALAAGDQGVRVLDSDGWGERWAFTGEGESLAVAFGPDSRVVAAGEDRGTVWLLEAKAGGVLARLELEGRVSTLAFSPDGALLAACGPEGAPRLWDATSGRELARLPGDATCGGGLGFVPGSGTLATAGREGVARLWDADGREVGRLTLDRPLSALAFSPTGEFLALGSDAGPVRLWKLPGGESRALPGVREAGAVAWSPEGLRVAAGGRDGSARVWTAADGRQALTLHHGARIIDLAFSPDGTLLATAGQDGTARVWDLAAGSEVARLTHTDNVNLARFSSDGAFLLTASQDRAARVWHVRFADPLAEACVRLDRNLTLEEWRRYLVPEPYRKTCPGVR
jgi:hypothetical protein